MLYERNIKWRYRNYQNIRKRDQPIEYSLWLSDLNNLHFMVLMVLRCVILYSSNDLSLNDCRFKKNYILHHYNLINIKILMATYYCKNRPRLIWRSNLNMSSLHIAFKFFISHFSNSTVHSINRLSFPTSRRKLLPYFYESVSYRHFINTYFLFSLYYFILFPML